jgi:hypothetical protein
LVEAPDKQDSHRIATLGEHSSGDKTVTAVIAPTGEHDDATAGALSRHDRFRDSLTRIFHQGKAGNPAAYGETIGFPHFSIGEDFDHCSTISQV